MRTQAYHILLTSKLFQRLNQENGLGGNYPIYFVEKALVFNISANGPWWKTKNSYSEEKVAKSMNKALEEVESSQLGKNRIAIFHSHTMFHAFAMAYNPFERRMVILDGGALERRGIIQVLMKIFQERCGIKEVGYLNMTERSNTKKSLYMQQRTKPCVNQADGATIRIKSFFEQNLRKIFLEKAGGAENDTTIPPANSSQAQSNLQIEKHEELTNFSTATPEEISKAFNATLEQACDKKINLSQIGDLLYFYPSLETIPGREEVRIGANSFPLDYPMYSDRPKLVTRKVISELHKQGIGSQDDSFGYCGREDLKRKAKKEIERSGKSREAF